MKKKNWTVYLRRLLSEREKNMEIAVLADIHSNYIALQRCMEYALRRGIKSFIFLGDYIGEMAYPERTMELLRGYAREYDCTFIRGNKEEYWMKQRREENPAFQEFSSTTGVLWYAYQKLTDEDIDFFESLPIARKLQYGDMPTLIACHGSPYSAKEKMELGRERTIEILQQSEVDLILCGHTHRQGKIVYNGKVVLNPGSVGLSLGARTLSQFMILHGEDGQWREEFVSLSYDTETVVEQLEESGLNRRAPGWCRITAHSLRNTSLRDIGHAQVLWRVMELCKQEMGECNWPNIPEKYWDVALAEFLG